MTVFIVFKTYSDGQSLAKVCHTEGQAMRVTEALMAAIVEEDGRYTSRGVRYEAHKVENDSTGDSMPKFTGPRASRYSSQVNLTLQ